MAAAPSRFPLGPVICLAVLFLLAVTYRLRDTSDRIEEILHGSEHVREVFDLDLPAFRVTYVNSEAEAAGLKVDDVILAVQGRPVRTPSDIWEHLRTARPGDRLAMRVRSPGAAGSAPADRDVSIVLQPLRAGPASAIDWATFVLLSLAMPYACLALGFWVAAVRVRDRQAWLLLFLLLGMAEFANSERLFSTIYGRRDLFQPIAASYQPLLANFWPTFMMLFAIYFPKRLWLDRRLPWLKWVIVVPIAFRTIGTNLVMDVVMRRDHEAALRLDQWFTASTSWVTVLQIVSLGLFFAIMGYKTATAPTADARRRLLLLDGGALVAIAPLVAYVLVSLAGYTVGNEAWPFLLLLGALFVLPATMAYVIVVERAMDVRVVVRQGVQYLLARGTVRVLQTLLSAGVIVAAVTMGGGRTGLTLALIAMGVAIAVVIGRFSDRLKVWVDRRFFREDYDAEHVLSDLASSVRTMVQVEPLLETVARRVSETLHVPQVAILLNADGMLEPAFALGYDGTVPVVPVRGPGFTKDTEAAVRKTLQAELTLPLSSQEKLVGVIGLGPKQSEEPFSRADVRLLDAVATQTGLALENSRLTTAIAVEIATREKARREIEIAREVQERFFPQEYPPVRGLEYAGACRPALGVGGDYYDFIQLSDSELGIAIGDVSGKGIPAALLMATLRAYLRGQTVRGGPVPQPGAPVTSVPDLAAMMANLNHLVFESSPTNRYATFFYGHYDAAAGVLHYVNGGHNPPMLFRRDGEVVRLQTGGAVIGLIAGLGYEQGHATLAPGDVLVAYTDGISEAMDGDSQEWGEERLEAAVHPHRATAPARDLIVRIMAGADAHVNGAPQHDDMTVVVVRRLDAA